MSENWKIQVSPKLTDGTLVNLRAETPDEAERILDWAITNAGKIGDAVKAVNAVSTFASVLPVAGVSVSGPAWSQGGPEGSAPPVQPQATYAQAATQQAPPVQQGGGEQCIHGAMKYKESAPGAAKSWKAWMCPTPKGTPGQCDPVWLR